MKNKILKKPAAAALDHIGEHLHAEMAAFLNGVTSADPGKPEENKPGELLAPRERI